MFIVVLQKIFWESVVQTLYFPLWWYTGGILYAGNSCLNLLRSGNFQLAPGLWLKNLFVPMYGQYDIQGRIISFLMRLFQVAVRSFAMIFWLMICMLLFLAWCALPLVIIYGFYSSFN